MVLRETIPRNSLGFVIPRDLFPSEPIFEEVLGTESPRSIIQNGMLLWLGGLKKTSLGPASGIVDAATDSKQGEKEFQTEVMLLARLHHRNLVNLVGYCAEKSQHMLIYVYMIRGSLASHLYSKFSSWLVQEAFPHGGDCSGLVVIYEDRYKDDLRYLKAENCVDAEVIYNFLEAKKIGVTHASFYISYALHMEHKNKNKTANEIFNHGLSMENVLSLHSLDGSSSVEWVEGSYVAKRQPLTWYKVVQVVFDKAKSGISKYRSGKFDFPEWYLKKPFWKVANEHGMELGLAVASLVAIRRVNCDSMIPLIADMLRLGPCMGDLQNLCIIPLHVALQAFTLLNYLPHRVIKSCRKLGVGEMSLEELSHMGPGPYQFSGSKLHGRQAHFGHFKGLDLDGGGALRVGLLDAIVRDLILNFIVASVVEVYSMLSSIRSFGERLYQDVDAPTPFCFFPSLGGGVGEVRSSSWGPPLVFFRVGGIGDAFCRFWTIHVKAKLRNWPIVSDRSGLGARNIFRSDGDGILNVSKIFGVQFIL
ncbi:mitotic spindle checkpoint protein bubr1 [Phtheirospermum japonicum]|uniref:Mitotic spindle checkpoint protein bubr1 n=1 Tax=Phtheirospermum japonicum TaxID=374723 RepID=A0A830CGG8_9LAMI|nr:mitotic spindle checkpoint protein bubr1 [Phtheirospermum japonicum]